MKVIRYQDTIVTFSPLTSQDGMPGKLLRRVLVSWTWGCISGGHDLK